MGKEEGKRPDPMVERYGALYGLDDVIRTRAADAVQHPILAYPTEESDSGSYEYFTGTDIDVMVDQAARILVSRGFGPVDGDRVSVVALFTPSDLDMVITFFALSRLGYAVMMLSTRLSAVACDSLLNAAGCNTILHGQSASIQATLDKLSELRSVVCQPVVRRSTLYEAEKLSSAIELGPNRKIDNPGLILHSSGSTGLPKPLFLSHRSVGTFFTRGYEKSTFNPLPWFHAHGLISALQAMHKRKTAFMWNASLPFTTKRLVAALEAARPEYVAAVPYVLQLLVDDPRGIDELRKCKSVSYGGAPCPDELGDRLLHAGVRFGGAFGMTEVGPVADSTTRPEGDPYWNYLKFFDSIRSSIWMKPIGNSLYETVYLADHPGLNASNSNDPPGSFHSHDVFSPHPTIPDRWKYITRIDDRITLVNGEKVLPLPIEGVIMQSPSVHEAVVVGVGKAVPGLLIFRAAGSEDLSDTEYLNTIWPFIEEANDRAEQFSQISRDMISVLPYGSPCPRTDKDSVIRAQVYKLYEELIESLYSKSEGNAEGTLELDLCGTQTHIMKICQEEIGLPISTADADFFAKGMDSQKAIHLRRLVQRDFRIPDGKTMGQNIVFETGTVASLAGHICALQSGQQIARREETSLMSELIEKYSAFDHHIPGSGSRTERSAILTGATGSLGVHTLLRLLDDNSITQVYCLTRRDNPKAAIVDTLVQKGYTNVPESKLEKIVGLNSSIEKPDFGIEDGVLKRMRQSVSLIIHTAWPVHFHLPLSSFEPHIKGLHNLLQFSLSVNLPSPAVTLFCSSVSTAFGDAAPDEVPETPLVDLNSALQQGYGRSKLVGEHLVSNAVRQAGARAYSLRIGQISGHSTKGLWNDSEAPPLMIRSALTLKALPELDVECSWFPVDKLAATIIELAERCGTVTPPSSPRSLASSNASDCSGYDDNGDDNTVYNLTNPRTFPWSTLLTTLQQTGFEFSRVPFDVWLQKLRDSEARGEEQVNPAVKLIAHYENMYAAGGNPVEQKKFCSEKAQRDSATLREGQLSIIEDGILENYARDWLQRWI